ncbi:MAG: VCBS repeat-containing protein [Verrucomicrobiales bacterium]|nr:VCBS repeat-containing protein [Verrucomicrobiales bacterium]
MIRWLSTWLILGSTALLPAVEAASAAVESRQPLRIPAQGASGFLRLEPSSVGIHLTNRLSNTLSAQNQILLNGSGVAAGDVDGDGLCDLYFCTLTEGNRLYRNLGDWRFADMTATAGIACEGQFSTGTCLADLDGDGDLDLLVNSIGGGTRFFQNDGRGKFTEQPDAGFQRRGGSHSIAVADVDVDGDLDVYITNYRTTTVRDNPIRVRLRQVNGKLVVPPPHEDRFLVHITAPGKGSLIELGEPDVLYRNEGNGKFTPLDWTGGTFRDETNQPLTQAPLDWGLSALFHDLNGDLRPDLYVCNDFSSPDRLWMGGVDAHLHAAPARALRHTSWASMSVDVADLDRDGFPELFVSDMLSADLSRRQTQRGNSSPCVQPEDEQWDRPQYLRNMLFWNQGNGTFVEMAPFAGVEASEWTWGAAFLDVDLDGYDDLLLATGHGSDMQDFDAAERIAQLRAQDPQLPAALLMTNYPPLQPPNVAFRNRGDLTFDPAGPAWGFDRPGITHGVILADLDNDGDLDVVTSDLNQSPGLYRNQSVAPRIAVRLKGKGKNTQGVGARIRLLDPQGVQQKEIIAGGRYLSGDESRRVFAANWREGQTARLEVHWPGGAVSQVAALERNQLYVIDELGAAPPVSSLVAAPSSAGFFEALLSNPLPAHQEAAFDDSSVQPLIPWTLSQRGPRSLAFDVDQDGLEDLVLGAGRGGSPSVWLNSPEGKFSPLPLPEGVSSLPGDVTAIAAFVTRAGESLILLAIARDETTDPAGSQILELRVRERTVTFTPWAHPLPMSAGTLSLADADGDGDPDLFVGGRTVTRHYPDPAPSQWYRNDGGSFVPETFGVDWSRLGLVTASVLADLTRDGRPDLVVATEWGALRLFVNTGQGFVERTQPSGLGAWKGLWTSLIAVDLDRDGTPELVAGNQGRNQLWNRFLEHPLRLYYGDINQSGSWATLLAVRPPGFDRYFPLNDLSALKNQVPRIGQQFTTHAEFARLSMDELWRAAEVPARHVEANILDHGVFRWRGERVEFHRLPTVAQLSVLNDLAAADFNSDGNQDLFLAQNREAYGPDTVRQDAGRGLILLGDGQGGFSPSRAGQTGIRSDGVLTCVSVADWNRDGKADLLLGEPNRQPQLYLNRWPTAQKPSPKP